MGKKSKRDSHSALPRVGASADSPDSHSAHSAQCVEVSQGPQVSPYPEIRFLEVRVQRESSCAHAAAGGRVRERDSVCKSVRIKDVSVMRTRRYSGV